MPIRNRALPAFIGVVLLAGGCNHGIVHTVPVARSDLPFTEPLIQTLPIQDAYYWIADDGRVNIALRYRFNSVLGPKFDAEWIMSLVLDKLPAGREKLYQLTTHEIRIQQYRGMDRRRGRAFSGVAVLQAPKGGRLRGRFHASIPQQIFSAFGGWTAPHAGPLTILIGEFDAIQSRPAGEPILKQTEADGFGRNTPVARVPTATAPS